MQRRILSTAIAPLALIAATAAAGPAFGQSLPAPTAPTTPTVPAPAPVPTAPATTVGPEARESAAAAEVEAEAEAETKASAKPAPKPKRSTDASNIRGTLSSPDAPRPSTSSKKRAEGQAATPDRTNSQGAANASVDGLANASTNSALAGAGKVELNAVTGGTAVIGTGGTSIGTVSGLVKNRAGATVGVQVKLSDGTTATIPASQLTLSGSTLTTTWVAKK